MKIMNLFYEKLDSKMFDSEAAHDLVRRASSELAVVTLNPQGDADLRCGPVRDRRLPA